MAFFLIARPLCYATLLRATRREVGMPPDDGEAPVLVLGPLLRYIGETEATIWVETDRPCQVEVLGHAARTFEVAGHHYALVVVTGLRPGSEHAYQVTLDGTVRWPLPDPAFGPSVLRTLDAGGPRRLVFGSCRIAELPPPRRTCWRAGSASPGPTGCCSSGTRSTRTRRGRPRAGSLRTAATPVSRR